MKATRNPECAVPGCDRPRRRSHWCGAHYARYLRHGDPLAGGKDRAPANQPCIEDGCERTARAHGRCRSHDKAHRLATDPEYAERRRAEWRDWAERNAEHLASRDKAYREANPERRAELLEQWKAANPWHASLHSYTKRRRRYGLPVLVVDQVDPGVIFDRDHGVCQLCLLDVDRDLPWPDPASATVDHIVPVVDPASEHSYANTWLAHWDCNRRKNATQEDQP